MASAEANIAPTPKNLREWEPVGVASDSTDGIYLKLRVMSYNVLAQDLLDNRAFLYNTCWSKYLQWEYRAARLYQEITNLSPDIMCLQEVQASHLTTFYSKFEDIGYSGLYKKKTGDTVIDGCAIYFKKSVFKLEDAAKVEFYQPKLALLGHHHIGIMVKLTPLTMPNSPIVVATTHLLQCPKKAIIRLAQLRLFLAEIDRFAYNFNGRESGHLPIILTGDFNSYPKSHVIQLLVEGQTNVYQTNNWNYNEWKNIGVTDNCQHLSVYLNRLEGRATDFSELEIQNSESNVRSRLATGLTVSTANMLHFAWYNEMFNSGVMSHSFHFRPVYDTNRRDRYDYFDTSTNQDRCVTVDHMFYSTCTTLRPLERLQLPSLNGSRACGQMPNEEYGSDHFSLVANFELKSDKPT